MFHWLTQEVGQSAVTYPIVFAAAGLDVGRFVPGGRTATTFAAGTLEMPYREFLAADAFAATLWAIYVCALGYFGGETFKDDLWLPLITSFSCAMAVGIGFEVWRRVQARKGKDILGDELPPEISPENA